MERFIKTIQAYSNKTKQRVDNYIYWYDLINRSRLQKDEWGAICPYGIGDTYFLCALAKDFLIHNGGNRFTVIVKKSQIDIPKLFVKDIERIVVLDTLNINALKKFSRFRMSRPFLAHPEFFSEGALLKKLGNDNTNILDLYKEAFNLPVSCALSKPEINRESIAKAKKKFKEMCLPYGKTVILAPDARSAKTLPLKFWCLLSDKLKQNGWTVCTNVIQNSNYISGTIPIEFSLDEAIPLVELAGWVISSRSGLCDLISSANCKLSIIYRHEVCYAGTIFKAFSLKKIGISSTADEYEIRDNEDWDLLISNIMGIENPN